MTRFEVFTYRHGDTVFTTRFRFVARVAVRFVKTLDFLPDPLPEGMERGTAAAARLCGCTGTAPIPLAPEAVETVTKTPKGWACTCGEADCPHILPWAAMEAATEEQEYDARICPDCGHDYHHDAQGRCTYPLSDEARVCGWHPDVMCPVPCESRVETPEAFERGRECYEGRCPRCHGEGCAEYWPGFKKAEREHLQEIREHDCEKSGCGPVCTAFES